MKAAMCVACPDCGDVLRVEVQFTDSPYLERPFEDNCPNCKSLAAKQTALSYVRTPGKFAHVVDVWSWGRNPPPLGTIQNNDGSTRKVDLSPVRSKT